jgi:hypothetical protein
MYAICIFVRQLATMKKGTKVRNQYGKILTVVEVIDLKMVRVREEYNNLYHITKVYPVKKFKNFTS